MRANRVIERAIDADSVPVGTYNSYPILNTRVNNVMIPENSVQQYSAIK